MGNREIPCIIFYPPPEISSGGVILWLFFIFFAVCRCVATTKNVRSYHFVSSLAAGCLKKLALLLLQLFAVLYWMNYWYRTSLFVTSLLSWQHWVVDFSLCRCLGSSEWVSEWVSEWARWYTRTQGLDTKVYFPFPLPLSYLHTRSRTTVYFSHAVVYLPSAHSVRTHQCWKDICFFE